MRRIYIVEESFPPSAETLAAAASLGAGEIISGGVPPGLIALGITTLGYHEYDDTPPVERFKLPKSVVQERLMELGKFETVWAIVFSDKRAFARWVVPDYPEVYADDPVLIIVLNYAGLTQEEILYVTS